MNTLRELKLESTIDNLNIVQKFVEDICDEYNINNTYFGNISIAIIEAVKNAIIHGNNNITTKKVILSFKQIEGSLLFVIKDEGSGFDIQSIPDPTEVEYSETKGNGIFLMTSLSDGLRFTNNGSTVEISFNIASINSTIALNRIQKLHSYSTSKETKELHNKE